MKIENVSCCSLLPRRFTCLSWCRRDAAGAARLAAGGAGRAGRQVVEVAIRSGLFVFHGTGPCREWSTPCLCRAVMKNAHDDGRSQQRLACRIA